jgi:predicted small lipoprotein YifL
MRVLILLSLLSIAACGVRGDLYLPEDNAADEVREHETPEQQGQKDQDAINE